MLEISIITSNLHIEPFQAFSIELILFKCFILALIIHLIFAIFMEG